MQDEGTRIQVYSIAGFIVLIANVAFQRKARSPR